ncbi:hypothetical protein CRG98_028720 [Punica granatum]|uniref:Uncharacterized protein n=1 Tax=Punica granatum TaxID=22663 RepID=A0A2I0J3V8_PUNGR|nr:hypothetical protein CRG98_028720 [Punica granatum]
MAWSSGRMHGFSTTGTVLRKDGGSRLKGVNSLKSGGDLWGPNRRSNQSPSCAHPNFVSLGLACASLNATWLGSVHLPGDARRTHVRRSRHLPFYDSKVEGRQVTQV